MKTYEVTYWDIYSEQWEFVICDTLSEAQDEFNRLDEEHIRNQAQMETPSLNELSA